MFTVGETGGKFTWELSVLLATWNNLKLFNDKRLIFLILKNHSKKPLSYPFLPVTPFLLFWVPFPREAEVPDSQCRSVADMVQLTAFSPAARGGRKGS